MEEWEERNHEMKEEELQFSTEVAGEIRVQGNWLGRKKA